MRQRRGIISNRNVHWNSDACNGARFEGPFEERFYDSVVDFFIARTFDYSDGNNSPGLVIDIEYGFAFGIGGGHRLR